MTDEAFKQECVRKATHAVLPIIKNQLPHTAFTFCVDGMGYLRMNRRIRFRTYGGASFVITTLASLKTQAKKSLTKNPVLVPQKILDTVPFA